MHSCMHACMHACLPACTGKLQSKAPETVIESSRAANYNPQAVYTPRMMQPQARKQTTVLALGGAPTVSGEGSGDKLKDKNKY